MESSLTELLQAYTRLTINNTASSQGVNVLSSLWSDRTPLTPNTYRRVAERLQILTYLHDCQLAAALTVVRAPALFHTRYPSQEDVGCFRAIGYRLNDRRVVISITHYDEDAWSSWALWTPASDTYQVNRLHPIETYEANSLLGHHGINCCILPRHTQGQRIYPSGAFVGNCRFVARMQRVFS